MSGEIRTVVELHEAIVANPDQTDALLARFVQENSFPLLDEDQATFFFWDGHDVEGLYLVHWVFGLEGRQPFVRIEGTNAYFLPLELPHGARIEYKFEVHRGGERHWIRDPLNDRLALDPFGANSVCPMTGYREPPWIEPIEGCRPGSMDEFAIESNVFGDRRVLKVYRPNEFRPHKTYPMVICHDGDDYLRFANMKTVLDNLIGLHEVAPILVVFTNGHTRNEEYGANPKQAQFLADEVLPAVASRYKISKDPEDRGLMGASFGGVSSLFCAWQYPGTFGRLLLQSGSFVFTDIGHHGRSELWDPVVSFVNAFREDPARVGARIYMNCGTHDGLIYYNRSLVPRLRRSGLKVRFSESRDGHNWICWRDRLREGLSTLFPGHLWMIYD